MTEFTCFLEKNMNDLPKKTRVHAVSCALGVNLTFSHRPAVASISRSISLSHSNRASVRNHRRISPPCK